MDEATREAFKRLEDENNRQNHRINLIEQTMQHIQDLTSSVQLLAHDMARMLDEQKAQGERLTALEEEPGDKWKKATSKAMDTIIGIVVGAAATGLAALALQYVK